MPEFSNPFVGNDCDKMLSEEELIRAVRFSMASEFEAIQLYEQIKEATDDEDAITLLDEIIDDEKVHVGNFMHLLRILAPEEQEHYKEGLKEAMDILSGKDDEDDITDIEEDIEEDIDEDVEEEEIEKDIDEEVEDELDDEEDDEDDDEVKVKK